MSPGPVLAALRRRADRIAREEVERTMRRIGADPEVEAHLAAMARALVAELLRGPSARLQDASAHGPGGERLADAAARMFGLAGGGAGLSRSGRGAGTRPRAR
jgi:glutamyl-tRNA reductase